MFISFLLLDTRKKLLNLPIAYLKLE